MFSVFFQNGFGGLCIDVNQILEYEISSHKSFVTGTVQSKGNDITWYHVSLVAPCFLGDGGEVGYHGGR